MKFIEYALMEIKTGITTRLILVK